MLGIGLGLWQIGAPSKAYETESVDLFARFTTDPGSARKTAIDTLITGLKSAGIWSKLDLLHVYAAHDSQAASLNWLSTSYTATVVNSPTFVADRYYETNGTNSYVDTNFAATTGGLLSSLNDACMFLWSASTTLRPKVWTAASPNQSLIFQDSATTCFGGLNHTFSAADKFTIPSNSAYLYSVERTASNASQFYTVGVSRGTASRASTAITPGEFFLGCQNANNGTAISFTAGRFSAFGYGRSLGTTAQATLSSLLTDYMTSVGNYP